MASYVRRQGLRAAVSATENVQHVLETGTAIGPRRNARRFGDSSGSCSRIRLLSVRQTSAVRLQLPRDSAIPAIGVGEGEVSACSWGVGCHSYGPDAFQLRAALCAPTVIKSPHAYVWNAQFC